MHIDGRENPLNIILPAYETLWRVVLRCFLEFRFRRGPDDDFTSQSIFMNFMSKPCKATFEAASEHQFPVKAIVLESLRLYPPTRRVYRSEDSGLVAVDIEFIHRDPATWGLDALRFDPRRIKNMKKQAFMPFGKGNFACPAKDIFAPMMIGILVGSLVEHIDHQFELVDEEGSVVDLGVEPLRNDREAYSGLRIRLKKRDGPKR
jgi:cytochrome P450